MSYIWIILILFAEIAWSVGIYIDKFLISKKESAEHEAGIGAMFIFGALFNGVVGFIILLALMCIFGVYGGFAYITFSTHYILSALFVGFLSVLWVLPYFYALHFADETTAPPVLQSIPIFGFFLGFFFFGELPDTTHIIASIIVIFGALLLNLEQISLKAKGGHVRFNTKSLFLMLFASFIVALISFLFKDIAEAENYWGTAFWLNMGALLTGFFTWILITPFGKDFDAFLFSKNWKLIGVNVVNETIEQVAMLAFYGAILLGPSTAVVQSTNAYQPLLLLTIAFILGKNGSKRHAHILTKTELSKRVVGVVCIVLGSVFIFG